MPAIIVLGDKTDHGGEVIEATGVTDTHGKGFARVGDKVYCPKRGHGMTTIVTGDMSFIVDGAAVAHEGCKTSCGAMLISSQAVTTLNFGGGGAGSAAAKGAASSGSLAGSNSAPATAAAVGSSGAMDAAAYDMHFLVLDEAGSRPLTDWPYVIELGNGARLEGRTDNEGKTAKVTAEQAEDATLRVYEPAVTPINPHWDR